MKCVLVTNASLCPCISGGEGLSKNHIGSSVMIDVMTEQILLLLYVCALLYRQMGLMSGLITLQNMLVKFVYFRSKEWNSYLDMYVLLFACNK